MELRPTRHAGRGGVGAVMGSKGVKVIVLDDTGRSMRAPKDPEKFKEANKKFTEGLKGHPVTGQGLPAYGTNVLTNILNEAGGYPTYNFKKAGLQGAPRSAAKPRRRSRQPGAGWPPMAATGAASSAAPGTYNDKDGHYLTKQPEYETVWAHGGNCGIDDLDCHRQNGFPG